MANLIITVISIALVAVAALSAAYYGGAAFMGGQDKAMVNQMYNNMEQVGSAIILYNAQTGQDFAQATTNYPSNQSELVPNTPDYTAPDEALLVPNYLKSLPQIITTSDYQFILKLRGGNNYTLDSGGGYFLNYSIGTDETSDGGASFKKLCKIAAERAGGTPIQINSSNVSAMGKFNCGWDNQGGNATTIDQCNGNETCNITIAYRVY